MTQESFPGGLPALQAQAASRRQQYHGWEGLLPAQDIDFTEWKAALTAPIMKGDEPSGHIIPKAAQLSAEFADAPIVLWLHALLIAMARRDPLPDQARRLFLRLWAEETPFLLERLDFRWKISAAATFRDIGETEEDRRAGMALAILFNLLKLTDSERALSGLHPARPEPRRKRATQKLALNQDVFALKTGDLDANLILYVWEAAAGAGPALAPLAAELMTALNQDRRSVFRRLSTLRQRAMAQDAQSTAQTRL
ncbi:MAG: hypothetical protein AAF841_14835 [Pseudomonadota bacterium]